MEKENVDVFKKLEFKKLHLQFTGLKRTATRMTNNLDELAKSIAEMDIQLKSLKKADVHTDYIVTQTPVKEKQFNWILFSLVAFEFFIAGLAVGVNI